MKCRGRAGSTLVEASIVMVAFLVMITGILDVGQVMFFHHFLTERVRAGARYAAVHTYDPAIIRNVVAYNSTSVPQNGGGLFGLDPSIVQVSQNIDSSGNVTVQVRITAFTMHFVSPWLMRDFTPNPFQAVMPVESGGNAR